MGLAVTIYLTGAAQGQLDQADNANTQLVATQRTFSTASSVLSDMDGIDSQLNRLFVDDVAVGPFVATLRATAPEGATFSSVNLTILGADESGAASSTVGGSAASLDDSGLAIIGSLDFTGNAPNEKTIAALIDSVTDVPGLTVPYIVSIRGNSTTGGYDFTAQATVTEALRSERFAIEDEAAQ
ncbi:MAG: Fimbrial assembly protein PilN [Glaciihabitans sp.]|nr:Fimbrial assembly protein PilN [Glaciihabitans sp.]